MPYTTNRLFRQMLLCMLIAPLYIGVNHIYAQCGLTISSFPYTEDFETSTGSWSTGGTASDWAWGTPAKSSITTAGHGTKCWVTGTLSGSFYSYSERSYVTSPCFNFSSIDHPYISFDIYWESEHNYDGTNLQYSTDGGTTWINVGATSDATDCLNQNWYNTNSVTYLTGLATVKNGWTGNSHATVGSCAGGSGSRGWVIASHCMPYLAHVASVKFRFTFGAGTICNDFDGIAFDNIYIGNAPSFSANFGYSCLGANNVAFFDSSSACMDTWYQKPIASVQPARCLSGDHD